MQLKNTYSERETDVSTRNSSHQEICHESPNKRWRASLIIVLSILLSPVAILEAADTDTEYTLANSGVSRTISWADGRLATKSIKNLLAAQTYHVTGHEFVVQLDGFKQPITSATAKVIDARVEKTSAGSRLVVTLSASTLAETKLRVVYELKADDFFGRKWIEIDPPNGKSLPIASISVESFQLARSVQCTKEGSPGQPIYIDDLFFGLEWPRSRNTFRGGILTCSHSPAWDVKAGFRSKSAVWGAAPHGEVANWFIEGYVPTIRISPSRPILVYNSWYDIRGAKLKAYEKTIAGFRDKLVKKHGVTLESFVVDDGWQNKDSIYETLFPDGFDKLRKTVEQELPGCNLGLWMPIGGGGSALTREWGLEHGYEVADFDKNAGRFGSYCLLGEKYTATLKNRLKYFISELNVNYFKHDFNKFTCHNAGHGHRVTGGAAEESQIEGMFRWMRYMKGLNKNVFLNYTSGMNLSPWWLMGCDCVWFGGDDLSFAGIGPQREREITYRAQRMRRDFGPRHDQFPTNAIMTHGIIKGRYALGETNRPIEEWQRDVLMYFGRGVMMWELYLTPELLTDEEWAFLAKTIKWARQNADVLAHTTRFILGDATKLEPYGYAHSKEDHCILFMRNPGSPRIIAELSKGWKVLRAANRDQISAQFAQAEFDDANWQKVDLPRDGKQPFNEEHIAYRHCFKVPTEWKGKPISLLFEGVDDNCEVYVNGAKVGAHTGWSKPFSFDVSKNLRYGDENLIAVLVENTGGGGGIYRSVGFIMTGEKEGPQSVSFTLAARTCGFDPKYKTAEIKWIYPEERIEPQTLKVGKPWTFRMQSFDVLVLDLKLKE